jgi:type I restriction enzyme, S subunit
VNQRVCRLRLKTGDARYFSYQLNRNPQLLRYDDGNEQTHLPNSAFKQLLLLEPPVDEQREISAYLDHTLDQLDAVVSRTHDSLSALQEHRLTLVTAAVTGQIDGLR